MKQYVLDEPGARAPASLPAQAAASHGRWRWPVVLAALVAVGLVAGRSFVEGRHEPAARAADATVVPVYVAPVAPVAVEPRKVAVAQPVMAPVEAPPSRVTRANGRYVVELHDAAIAPVLAMLGDATRTTVTGSDVVSASPARITTSFVADSPLDAWKGVFGDLASFAMTCGHSGCAVRFVSLVGPTSSASNRPVPSTSFAPPAAPDAAQSGESMPDN